MTLEARLSGCSGLDLLYGIFLPTSRGMVQTLHPVPSLHHKSTASDRNVGSRARQSRAGSRAGRHQTKVQM